MKVGAASAIKLAWLVVDFDGTCTVRDTTPTIACLAAAHNNGGVEQLSSFGVHERDYMEGHARLLGGGELEGEPSAAVDVAALSAFLAALDDHSTRTTREVSRSGVLAGLDGRRRRDVYGVGGGRVVGQLAPRPPPSLQPGCAAALPPPPPRPPPRRPQRQLVPGAHPRAARATARRRRAGGGDAHRRAAVRAVVQLARARRPRPPRRRRRRAEGEEDRRPRPRCAARRRRRRRRVRPVDSNLLGRAIRRNYF